MNVTGEATTGDGAHKVYQVTNAAHRVLSRTATITVKVDGVAADADTYTLDRLAGKVTFAAAQARSYEYELAASNLDATTFVNDGWTARAQGQRDVSGSVGAFMDTSDPLFRDALLNGTVMVLAFYPDVSAAASLLCWAVLAKVNDASAVDALVTEDVDFEGTADADGRVVSNG